MKGLHHEKDIKRSCAQLLGLGFRWRWRGRHKWLKHPTRLSHVSERQGDFPPCRVEVGEMVKDEVAHNHIETGIGEG